MEDFEDTVPMDDSAFEGGGVSLECPMCGADVDYEEVLVPDAEGCAGCPECGGVAPTDEWFA